MTAEVAEETQSVRAVCDLRAFSAYSAVML
jgi:hypothetical protein